MEPSDGYAANLNAWMAFPYGYGAFRLRWTERPPFFGFPTRIWRLLGQKQARKAPDGFPHADMEHSDIQRAIIYDATFPTRVWSLPCSGAG